MCSFVPVLAFVPSFLPLSFPLISRWCILWGMRCMIINVNVQRAESTRNLTSSWGSSAKTFSGLFYFMATKRIMTLRTVPNSPSGLDHQKSMSTFMRKSFSVVVADVGVVVASFRILHLASSWAVLSVHPHRTEDQTHPAPAYNMMIIHSHALHKLTGTRKSTNRMQWGAPT